MSFRYDRTAQLAEAKRHGRFAQAASLMAAGTPTRQHNVGVDEKPAKKAAAKKTAAKKTPSKTAAKKATATPAAKKAAKKS